MKNKNKTIDKKKDSKVICIFCRQEVNEQGKCACPFRTITITK